MSIIAQYHNQGIGFFCTHLKNLSIGGNKEVHSAVCRICHEYSNGLYDGLTDTSNYVRENHPEDTSKFIDFINCICNILKSDKENLNDEEQTESHNY